VDNTVYEPHKNAVKNSGIKEREFVLYALRHSCLTRWGNSGMDAWTLARLAGHSNIRQSMTYVHPSDTALHAAIDRMSDVRGGDEIRDNEQNVVPAVSLELVVASSSQKS
jgi:integrase